MSHRNFGSHSIYIALFLTFLTRPAFAFVDEALKSKLTNLLYILGPLVFIVSAFVLLEWRKKSKMPPTQSSQITSPNKR